MDRTIYGLFIVYYALFIGVDSYRPTAVARTKVLACDPAK